MATFTITMVNAINVFGVAPSDKWNERNWNAFLWGEGTNDLGVTVTKYLANSITPADTIGKNATIGISNSLSPTAEMTSETLSDGSGYNYVFPDNTTDAESRDPVTWASGSAGSSTWTSAAAGSTTWSEA